jgi:hypothetical protein
MKIIAFFHLIHKNSLVNHNVKCEIKKIKFRENIMIGYEILLNFRENFSDFRQHNECSRIF